MYLFIDRIMQSVHAYILTSLSGERKWFLAEPDLYQVSEGSKKQTTYWLTVIHKPSNILKSSGPTLRLL